MGFALLALDTDPPRLVTCGVVETPRGGTNAERLLAIATALDSLIAEHAPTALAVERLYFNKNVKTAMAVAEARGIALLCGARARVEIAEYTPQQVKMAVTGNGGADKKAVQQMLVHVLKLEARISDDNVADAVAVAVTHAHRARFDVLVASAK
jgi:crossover junction endodeoxyribonuclease RuvC